MKIDKEKINECGHDLMMLSNEMNSLISDMFDNLSSIQRNNSWVGNSAEKFIKQIELDKLDAIDLKNELYQYGKYLQLVSEKYEDIINECECDKF